MVECHLLGSGRALLAQERKKVRRNPREMGCACARTSNFPETFPREQPQPGWLTLQNASGNVHWLPTTPKPPGRTSGEWIQAKIRPGTMLVVWVHQQQDIPWH